MRKRIGLGPFGSAIQSVLHFFKSGVKCVKIPEFKSMEEERNFWNTHDTTEFLDELEPVDAIFVRRKPMTSISLRLPNEDLEKIKRIAKKHGIPYTTLIRNMIKRELGFLEKQEVGSK